MEWISVKDDMPAKRWGWSNRIIFYSESEGVLIGKVHFYETKNKWITDTEPIIALEDITHWMPLPSAPKN